MALPGDSAFPLETRCIITNHTGCGRIIITLIPILGVGIIGIVTTNGLGTGLGIIPGTTGLIGTIPGTGTTRIGGITVITPTAPVAEEAIARLYKNLRTGIRAIRLRAYVPDRTETRADDHQGITVLRAIRPSVRKAMTAALRVIRLLPVRGRLQVPDNNPVRDHLPGGTGAIRPLRPTASVRATKIYAEDHHHHPAGEVRLQARKTG